MNTCRRTAPFACALALSLIGLGPASANTPTRKNSKPQTAASAKTRTTAPRPATTRATVATTPAPASPASTAPARELEPDDAALRLLVSDGKEAVVRVVDLGTGGVIASIPVAEPARLYPTTRGRYVIATQREQSLTSVIDSGLVRAPHGDHQHLTAQPPSVSTTIRSSKPTHVVAHDDHVMLFNDGDGSSTLFNVGDLGAAPQQLSSIYGAHHGVSAPVPGGWVTGLTNPGETLPSGVALIRGSSTVAATFPYCPGLHGEASGQTSAGEFAIGFGCSNGVLLLRSTGNGQWNWSRYQFAPDRPAGTRTGTLVAQEGVPYLVGNYGSDLARFELDGSAWRQLPLGSRQYDFRFDPLRRGMALALLATGELVRVDPRTGTITDRVPVLPPVTSAGGEGAVGPSLAVGTNTAYVTNPAGSVVEINLATFTVSRRLSVPGIPFTAAVAGVSEH